MNDRADPHSRSRTGVFPRRAAGSRARWTMDGRAGEALARKGNSSMTATVSPFVAMRIRRAIASSQCSKRNGTLSPQWAASACPNWRRASPSVVSVAVNMKPPEALVSASRRKVLPCRLRPDTTPRVASGPE